MAGMDTAGYLTNSIPAPVMPPCIDQPLVPRGNREDGGQLAVGRRSR